MTSRSERQPLTVSVVIPCLDEAVRIGARLRELQEHDVAEVIVVDGGSRDGTLEECRRHADVRVLTCTPGRGSQMNAGAAAAEGDVLLFLHADCRLPGDAVPWVRRTLATCDVVGGAFRLHTIVDRGESWLAPLLRLADLRSRWTRLPYGDQAIFCLRRTFLAVDGYPDQPLLEDVELARRLWREGRLATVPAEVQASGRRFLARPIYYTVAVHAIPLAYRLGIPVRWLHRAYPEVR